MPPLFDIKCQNPECNHRAEVYKTFDAPEECSLCGHDTVTLMPTVKGVHGFGKQPYDYLDGPVPDSKPIKSFSRDRRKGGKNRN